VMHSTFLYAQVDSGKRDNDVTAVFDTSRPKLNDCGLARTLCVRPEVSVLRWLRVACTAASDMIHLRPDNVMGQCVCWPVTDLQLPWLSVITKNGCTFRHITGRHITGHGAESVSAQCSCSAFRLDLAFRCPNSQKKIRYHGDDYRMSGSEGPDPILLTLFANRFMSVAEAMGRSLQQTSISTNIKERLDFSCALFAPDGDLVANAPFIPIHLGSMSLCV
jgi:hypothetical protein